MQRVELSIDHHHPILAHLAVGAAGVEELDDGQFPSWQLSHRTGQRFRVFHPQKMAPGVKAGRPHQQRETEAVARNRGGGLRRREKFLG